MATTTAIIAGISTIGEGILSVFTAIYNFVLKPLFIIIKYLFFFLEFVVGNILQIFIWNVKEYLEYLFGTPLGPRIYRPKPIDEVFFFFQVAVDELKSMIATSLVTILIALGIGLVLAFSIVIAFLVLWLLQYIYPYIFAILNFLNIFLNFAAQLLAIGLNLGMEFLTLFAPTWNDFVKIVTTILGQILGLICNGTTTYVPSSNFAQSCPILNDFFVWLLSVFDEVIAFFASLANLSNDTYSSLAGAACYGGTCQTGIQQVLMLDPSYNFSPAQAVDFFNSILQFIITYVFPIVQSVMYFVLDVIIFFFKTLIGTIGAITTDSNLGAFIVNQVTNPGLSLVSTLPAGFVRTVLLGIENFFLVVLGAVITTIQTIAILFDSLVCNIFMGFRTCFLSKLCYSIFKPFPVDIIIFVVVIPFDQIICANGLGLYPNQCQCDICPFSSPLNAVICFFTTCVGGNLMVPCNGLSSCSVGCNGNLSILRFILPF